MSDNQDLLCVDLIGGGSQELRLTDAQRDVGGGSIVHAGKYDRRAGAPV
jgi:hypothetical protein